MLVTEITVEQRARRVLGDLTALTDSLQELGMLAPIGVKPNGTLLFGARRLEAARRLGWAEVPVRIFHDANDALTALRIERDENACREDFSPSEAVVLGEEIERLERAAAAERQRQHGGTAPGRQSTSANLAGVSSGETRDRVADAVGMGRTTFKKAKEIVEAARAEPERFEALVQEMDRTGRVSGVHTKLKRTRAFDRVNQAAATPLPEGKYNVIALDPPWQFDREEDATHRASCPYPPMSLDQILALPVAGLAAADCVLWLWCTNVHMHEAFHCLEAWGFTYKGILTWDKETIGCGNWLRGQTEHCLLAIRGRPAINNTSHSTLIRERRREHSRKPEAFFQLVESICAGSKLELFARQRRHGWTSWGAEVDKFDDDAGVAT